MRAKGNGSVNRCAENLLAIVRGEVPYDRCRGLDARLVDMPTATAEPEIRQDATWVLETYEPRADVDKIEISGGGPGGGLAITARIR